MLDSFFESISWPMEPPPAYGAFHILFTLIGFAVCGFSAWKLRNVSDKAAGLILFFCGLVLSLSEVFKQFFCFYVIADNTYHWGEFPFQLCSIPMYMCLIAPWLKPGKAQRAMYSFMVLYNLLGGAIAFAEPSGLLHGHLFLTIHSCVCPSGVAPRRAIIKLQPGPSSRCAASRSYLTALFSLGLRAI